MLADSGGYSSTILDGPTFPHTQNKLTWDLVVIAWHAMLRRHALYPSTVHVRGEWVDQAVQTITASDSLSASPNPLHLHRTQCHKQKFLGNFWKNRRRQARAGYRETKQSHQALLMPFSQCSNIQLKLTAGRWYHSWAKRLLARPKSLLRKHHRVLCWSFKGNEKWLILFKTFVYVFSWFSKRRMKQKY